MGVGLAIPRLTPGRQSVDFMCWRCGQLPLFTMPSNPQFHSNEVKRMKESGTTVGKITESAGPGQRCVH